MGSVGGGAKEVLGKCRRQSWGSVGGRVWSVGELSEPVSRGACWGSVGGTVGESVGGTVGESVGGAGKGSIGTGVKVSQGKCRRRSRGVLGEVCALESGHVSGEV